MSPSCVPRPRPKAHCFCMTRPAARASVCCHAFVAPAAPTRVSCRILRPFIPCFPCCLALCIFPLKTCCPAPPQQPACMFVCSASPSVAHIPLVSPLIVNQTTNAERTKRKGESLKVLQNCTGGGWERQNFNRQNAGSQAWGLGWYRGRVQAGSAPAAHATATLRGRLRPPASSTSLVKSAGGGGSGG